MTVVTEPRRKVKLAPPLVPAEVPADPISDLLERAADIIAEKGWARGNFAAWGRYCALGAIGAAANQSPGPRSYRRRLRDDARDRFGWFVVNHFGTGGGHWPLLIWHHVAHWNDGRAKSRAEVVRALKEAAAEGAGHERRP